MVSVRTASMSMALAMFLSGVLSAADFPLGHPDFYPSPERSIGLRGDGNGYFPGATFVGDFWEGTPVEAERTYDEVREGRVLGQKKGKAWDFSDSKTTTSFGRPNCLHGPIRNRLWSETGSLPRANLTG